jgi:hypothetical protein
MIGNASVVVCRETDAVAFAEVHPLRTLRPGNPARHALQLPLRHGPFVGAKPLPKIGKLRVAEVGLTQVEFET